LQKETGITAGIDPLGGSNYIEYLTEKLVERARLHLKEIESYGGMTKAIEKGIPKMRIEEAAAKKQARIDSYQEFVVGVNVFQNDKEANIDTLEVDNKKVRESQINRINSVREDRDNDAVLKALDNIRSSAKSGKNNLLELAVVAAKQRATLGEISEAMEETFGRFVADSPTISGVYSKAITMDKKFASARALSDKFAVLDGRRPRIMIAKLGQDGHDRGAKVIATSFADIGFDVDIGPLFQTPDEAAIQAIENDVHILGISSLAAGHKTLVPETIEYLKSIGRDDIMVVVGGVVPPKDYQFLFDQGVAAVFGPGTIISEAASEILNIMIAIRE